MGFSDCLSLTNHGGELILGEGVTAAHCSKLVLAFFRMSPLIFSLETHSTARMPCGQQEMLAIAELLGLSLHSPSDAYSQAELG